MLAAILFVSALQSAPKPTSSPCAIPATRHKNVSAPTPCPSASPGDSRVIAEVVAHGRQENLVGRSAAASIGTINQTEIATRPILRPGEVLEAIPGLVISQHSGGGKANQYYLRGFQLDHGTDLAATISGVPINLPTHAHGQGYSDINWLIPELVSFVQFKKGPYYADEGDFSTAGAYRLFYRNTIEPVFELTGGGHGYSRIFVAVSPRVGSGALLYGFEYAHDNSTIDRPDNYRKFNGVLRYSRSNAITDFNVTAMAYNGTFNSSDQIPQRLVQDAMLDRFGLIDPTDGGATSRLALSSEITRHYDNGDLQLNIYGFRQHLDLFSNFTYYADDAADYYNVTRNPVTCNATYVTCTPGYQHVANYTSYCPANGNSARGARQSIVPVPFAFACGDQRQQDDQRFVSGFNISRSISNSPGSTLVGGGLRNDNISTLGLFLTHDRVRYQNGTLSSAHVAETDVFLYAQCEFRLGSRLRLIPGLRADMYAFHVAEPAAANSGRVRAGIVSPKFVAAYRLSQNAELYADYGESFHSNDGRGAVETLDPQTHAAYDPSGTAIEPVTPLVRAQGAEFGFRYATSKMQSTVSLWQLNLASELIFGGDHGVTFAGRPTQRRGIEIANFFSPTSYLTLDADFATSTAKFLTDPKHIGTAVPESLAAVISAGATIDEPHYAASLRVRYFGPRDLIEDGSAHSPPSTILNGQFTAKFRAGLRLRLDVLNILNAQAADVTYYYGSWLPQDAANRTYALDPSINPALGGVGVSDYHFHPSESRTLRLTLTTKL